MQIFKSELQSILNHFFEGNKNMNEQVFGQNGFYCISGYPDM